jgi:FkbM family methyltransferase
MIFDKKIIFDVGAFDGSDGLMLALKNKNHFIYAFEANLDQYKIIKKNKSILENRIGKKIINYEILNFAVSNLNNINKYFYVAKNPAVSSLNKFSNNFKKTWKGYEKMFLVSKTLKVKTITLSKFCFLNSIKKNSLLALRYSRK